MIPYLQIGDVAQALNSNPSYLLLFVVFTAGYAFLALSSRKTTFWKGATEYEKVLVGVAIGGGFAVITFFFIWGIDYSIKWGIDYLSVYYASLITASIILVLVSLIPRSEKIPEAKIRQMMRIISGVILYLSSVILVFFVTLTFVVQASYSPSVRAPVVSFLSTGMIYWFLAFFFGWIFYFSYTNYFYNQLREYIYLETIDATYKTSVIGRTAIRVGTQFNSLTQNKKIITIILVAILLSVGGLSLDYSTTAFTPKITTSNVISHPMNSSYVSPVDYFLFVQTSYSNWYDNYSGPCNLTSYQLVNRNYTIQVPWDSHFSSDSAVILYPNSTDQTPENYSDIGDIVHAYYPVWQDMYILNHTQIGIIYGTNNISLNLANAPHPSSDTIAFYYFQKAKTNVSCRETLDYIENYNHTIYSDIQTIDFKNNGNTSVVIQTVDLPFYSAYPYSIFKFGYNETGIKNGELNFFYGPDNYGAYANTPCVNYLPPNYEMNYTIDGSCSVTNRNDTVGSGSCDG